MNGSIYFRIIQKPIGLLRLLKSTFPNKTNYLYRKDYVCQHSSKNKKLSIHTTRNRNKQCQAVIKKDTVHTRRWDKHLRDGLNTEIQVGTNEFIY